MTNTVIRDGHIHSPICPHGSNDSYEMYIEKAINIGLSEITFTEHLPLPSDFMTKEMRDFCSPNLDSVKGYISSLKEIRKQYQDKIKINIGFEVDYLEGYEEFTKGLLNQFGCEDGLLSVHFLRIDNKFYCLDESPAKFLEIANKVGGVKNLYDLYYQTIYKSLKADLGKHKPNRIGHPTLVRIFNKEIPFNYQNHMLLTKLLSEIKKRNFTIDYNMAGLRKPYCGETYPSGLFLDLVNKLGVKMIYGSDAHCANDLGKGYYISNDSII